VWSQCSGHCEFKAHGSPYVIAGLVPAIPVSQALQN
jgi:hypothetical protein